MLKWELLDGLLTLVALLYFQARRNEHILRLEFMSQLKVIFDTPTHTQNTLSEASKDFFTPTITILLSVISFDNCHEFLLFCFTGI